MHGINECIDMVWIYVWSNAVTKIKHMPIACTKAIQNISHFGANDGGRCIKYRWVHIPLQRASLPYALSGLCRSGMGEAL